MGFGFGFQWSFRTVLFGFRFLFDPSGYYAPPLISNSRETSVCSSCQHRIGSIRVLRTGMWTIIGFDCFACGFRFWSNFFFFAVLRLWMIFFDGFEVCNRTLSSFRTVEFHTDSCFANWKSLFLKLQIFPFVLFRVLNYSRPCLVISSEMVWGILLIFSF